MFLPSATGVPSSAVLVFDIELLSFEKGVPPGYLFVWLQNSPENLFEALDMDKNLEVPLQEVSVCCRRFKLSSWFFFLMEVASVMQAA